MLIVDDNDQDKILLVIRPIASYSLTNEERVMMKHASNAMINSIQETLEGFTPQISGDRIATEINKVVKENVRTPIHEFIPLDFYHKHKVYPEALFKAFYVRDVVYAGRQIQNDVLLKLKSIFEKEEINGGATLEEYRFVKSVCGQWYTIPEDKILDGKVLLNQEDNNTEDTQRSDDDMLSC